MRSGRPLSMRALLVAVLLLSTVLAFVPAADARPIPVESYAGPGGNIACEYGLVVCEARDTMTFNGLRYTSIDCGAFECEVLLYNGHVKDYDCTLA